MSVPFGKLTTSELENHPSLIDESTYEKWSVFSITKKKSSAQFDPENPRNVGTRSESNPQVRFAKMMREAHSPRMSLRELLQESQSLQGGLKQPQHKKLSTYPLFFVISLYSQKIINFFGFHIPFLSLDLPWS